METYIILKKEKIKFTWIVLSFEESVCFKLKMETPFGKSSQSYDLLNI